MLEVCNRCGRTLDTDGIYYGYVHYRADTVYYEYVPCIELSPQLEKLVNKTAVELGLRAAHTLDELLGEYAT